MSMDSLIQELGDCGLFQILMVSLVHSAVVPAMFTQTFMAFGNYDPGWICNDDQHFQSHLSVEFFCVESLTDNVRILNKSHEDRGPFCSCEDYKDCENVTYNNDSSTIVTEWNLACNKRWITSLMISAHKFGYVIGSLNCGIGSDRYGRKPMHLLGLAIHLTLNLMSIFSLNWPIFTVTRFFLGITTGSLFVSSFVYPMEFVTDKWRAIISAIPFMNFGNVLFSVFALLFRDWRKLHLVTAIATVICFIPVFFIPESVRWLSIKGKTDAATDIVDKMSKINRKKPKNINIILSIAEEEKKAREKGKNYSVSDLYRHGLAKTTNIMTYLWVYISACTTIIIYGIQSLSGDFYVNLILFHLVPCCVLPFSSILTNTIGRKKSTLILLSIACISCLGLICLHLMTGDFNKGLGILVLTLIFLLLMDAIWSIVMLLCIELYPTGLRSTSYSFVNCIGSVVDIIAPFLIPHDQATLFVSHIIMAVLTLIAFISFFDIPETKGKPLDESLPLKTDFNKN